MTTGRVLKPESQDFLDPGLAKPQSQLNLGFGNTDLMLSQGLMLNLGLDFVDSSYNVTMNPLDSVPKNYEPQIHIKNIALVSLEVLKSL